MFYSDQLAYREECKNDGSGRHPNDEEFMVIEVQRRNLSYTGFYCIL